MVFFRYPSASHHFLWSSSDSPNLIALGRELRLNLAAVIPLYLKGPILDRAAAAEFLFEFRKKILFQGRMQDEPLDARKPAALGSACERNAQGFWLALLKLA